MSSSENSDIRQLERGLFASMAKVRQPMAPDQEQEPLQLGGLSSQDFAELDRAEIKALWPGLTPSQVDELANF
jgi:hypothetical protein